MKKLILISGILALNNSSAETVFSDINLWIAANNNVVTEEFQVDMPDAAVLSFDSGLTITGSAPMGTLLDNRVAGGEWTFRIYNAGGNEGFETIVIDLPAPVFTFGIELRSVSSSRGLTIKGNWDGQGLEETVIFPFFGNVSTGFFGVIGDQPFNQVFIDASNPTVNGDDFVLSQSIMFEDIDLIFSNGFQ